jgi:NADP-dependent 3-hydroxy acid dehydrogenase YdfG
MRLKDKVALITGATGGMGSASARLFAREGAAVAVAARHQDQGDALVKEITDGGGRAIFVELEITDQGQ